MIAARICGRCGVFIRGPEPCETCLEAKRSDGVQIGMIDGPTHMSTDDPMFKRDPNDRWKRRIVPNKAAYREHIARSNGKLEAIG